MKVVSTSNAPAAIGPYSQGFVVGNLLITSGQIPVNPENGEIPGDITSQAEQSCKNVKAILQPLTVFMRSILLPSRLVPA